MKKIRNSFEVQKSLIKIVGASNVTISVTSSNKRGKASSFSPIFTSKPSLVVRPETTEHVSKLLRLANKHKISVTVGTRSSHITPGILLDITHMNKILKIYPDDFVVKVQPSITGDVLNDALNKHALFFPLASGSSRRKSLWDELVKKIGGIYAIKQWILSFRVVLADGTIIHTGDRLFGASSEYDLTTLFMGSHDPLGIVTEITLRLAPVSQAKFAIMVAFPTVVDAAMMVLHLLRTESKPLSIEFMDASYMVMVNLANNITLSEKPSLIIECSGNKDQVLTQVRTVKSITRKYKALEVNEFKTTKQNQTLWDYHIAARIVVRKVLPKTSILSLMVVLPLSQIPLFLRRADELSSKHGIQTIMSGQIGDGRLECWLLYDEENKPSLKAVSRLSQDLSKYIMKLGGATNDNQSVKPIQAMKKIKKVFDPNGILLQQNLIK